MLGVFDDVRYAVRRLARTPGFTLATVLTIALGVGVNTGTFSLLNAIALRDVAVPEADELFVVHQSVSDVAERNEKGVRNPRFTTAEFEAYRDRSETLIGLMGYSLPWPATLDGAVPLTITGRYVTCGYFDVLRQPPALGRALTAEDCARGAPPVVVLSHAFWLRHFAADPAIAGRTVTMNGQSLIVVGIAAADAHEPGMQRLDYYVPITAQPYLRPDRRWLVSDDSGWLELMGRRNEHGSISQLRAELSVIAAAIDHEDPGRSTTVFVERATPISLRKIDTTALSFGGTVVMAFALVLLIACVNVANLFLARALTDAPAIAMRSALGASRGRIVRQLLTESLLVAIAGGIAGTWLAVGAVAGLAGVLTSSSSIALPVIALDFRVLAFALTLSLGTGVACGLVPGLRASRPDLDSAARQGSGGHRQGWLRSTLIAVQVAACAVLLVGAGLLLRGLYAAHTVDPGFPYRSVASLSFELRGLGYSPEEIAAFHRRVADEVRAVPGVTAVGFGTEPPLAGSNSFVRFRLPGSDAVWRTAPRNMVTPEYFSAAGVPIVLGRTFTSAEQTSTSAVVVVSESTARNLWPGENAVGQTLARRVDGNAEARWEVVGVARDAQLTVIGETDPYYVYEPIAPQFQHQLDLIVRARTDVASIAPFVQSTVQRLEPRLAVEVRPVEANIEASQQRAAFVTTLAVVVGALASGLVAVGIYGVVAFVVARRERELGLRMALGARSGHILGLVLGRTMRPVAIGALAGVLAAMAASAVLSSVLFGVDRLDPLGIGGPIAFLLCVAAAASVPAARRATRASPMTTIRHE